MLAQVDQGPLNAAAIAVSSLATRKARPHVSAMSIQLFDTSIPIKEAPDSNKRGSDSNKEGSAMRRSPDTGVLQADTTGNRNLDLNGLKNALP